MSVLNNILPLGKTFNLIRIINIKVRKGVGSPVDGGSSTLFILLFLFLAGAAYCASSEISFASVSRIRLKSYADNGDKRAINAMYITDNFNKALTTLLIGNNITHIAFASVATLISTRLWGVQSVKYKTIVSTFVVFLFSEMIPKSYGKENNTKIALAVSGSLRALMKILTPVAYFFTLISNGVSKLFPARDDEPFITEEELYDIIETANEEGVLDEDQQELVHSALDFDDITVGDIFTAKKDIIALDISSSQEEILEIIKKYKYSRIPVYKDNIDNIIGILPVRKFLKAYIKNEAIELKDILLKPHYTRCNMPIDDMLKEMSSKKFHISIVIDGEGKTLGIVTLEDILEELVGEIWDEDDIVNI